MSGNVSSRIEWVSKQVRGKESCCLWTSLFYSHSCWSILDQYSIPLCLLLYWWLPLWLCLYPCWVEVSDVMWQWGLQYCPGIQALSSQDRWQGQEREDRVNIMCTQRSPYPGYLALIGATEVQYKEDLKGWCQEEPISGGRDNRHQAGGRNIDTKLFIRSHKTFYMFQICKIWKSARQKKWIYYRKLAPGSKRIKRLKNVSWLPALTSGQMMWVDVRDLRFARMGRHLAVAILLLVIANIAATSQPSISDEYKALLRPEPRSDWTLDGGRRHRDNDNAIILTREDNRRSITADNQSLPLTGDNICTRRET